MFILNQKLAMDSMLSSDDEAIWESAMMEQNLEPEETDPRHDPVYECCDTALWRKRLVLTPYMLLDRLQACAELAKEAQDRSNSPELVANRVDRFSDEVTHLLRLLERSGLWTDTALVSKDSCDGHTYQVLKDPFVASA